MAARAKFTDEELEKAIREAHGILAHAARILSKGGRRITRQAIEQRIATTPELQAVAYQEREALTDFAENKLFELIKAGDKTSIIFYLKCKAKNRGYVERQELTGKDGLPIASGKIEPVEVTVRIVDPAKNED